MKKVLFEMIVKCENAGIFVDLFASDMGPNNMSLLKALGISVKKDSCGNLEITNKIVHPVDPGGKLFVFCDVPHLQKNVATGWRTYSEIQIGKVLCKKYGFKSGSVIDINHVSIIVYFLSHQTVSLRLN